MDQWEWKNWLLHLRNAINGRDIVFEWIPYNQLSDIKEIGRGGFATVYSEIWKDGLLDYDKVNEKYTRKSNYKVALKCLHNSQNIRQWVFKWGMKSINLNLNFKHNSFFNF